MTRTQVELEDRLAVTDLLAGYCHAMDACRSDLCIRLFADDAILDTPVGRAQGRAAILAWIEGRFALRPKDFQVGHHLLNPLLAPVDANRIRVRSMLLYTRQSLEENGRSELLSTGIYEDEMTRTGEGWRFARRKWTLKAPLDDVYFGAIGRRSGDPIA